MEKVILKIGEIEVRVDFTFSVLRKLGKKWGLKTVNEVLERIVKSPGTNIADITFEAMDVFSDVLLACSDTELSKDDVINYLFSNPDALSIIVDAFADCVVNKSESSDSEKSTTVGK